MKSTEHWLVHDHTQFENLLGQCLEAADVKDWWELEKAFNEMVEEMKYHMAQEEEVLYPAYDARTKAPYTPTESLRQDHDRIVQLTLDTDAAIKSKDQPAVMELIDNMVAVITMHHEKEEDIFLPMATHILNSEREELSIKLNEFKLSDRSRKWGI